MNILLFVMTMLMLLALMTYGRLESFRGFAFVQAQFKEYMEKTERSYVIEEARKRYQSERGSSKEAGEEEKAEKNGASSKLSFNLFVDKEERAKHPAEFETHKILAKNLLYYLYGEQPFFVEMEEKRPGFVDEIFTALVQVTDEYSPAQKLNPKKVKEIATVDFGNQDLNEAFTKMLKGSVDKVATPVEEPEESARSAAFEPSRSYNPERGYSALLDFITIERNKLKIRVFLASPQLLMALYGNENTVRNIIETRYELYRQLVNEEITAEAGKMEFQGQFQNQQLPEVPPEMLDFGISKTNAIRYI